MSDTRKFSWGLFLGLGVFAFLLNEKIWVPISHEDGSLGIIVAGLTFGSLAVIIFGRRAA